MSFPEPIITSDHLNNQSLDREIEVREECALHHFRTEIPNIVLELNLTPIELAVYIHLKRIAGDKGQCFKSTSALAKSMGVCENSYKKARKRLESPFELLMGRPLIKSISRTSPTVGSIPPLIEIVFIWDINIKVNMKNRASQNGAPPHHNMVDPGSSVDGAGSSDAYKEEPIKKIPLDKKDILFKNIQRKSPLAPHSPPIGVSDNVCEKKTLKSKPQKIGYGHEQACKLTDDELKKLIDQFGKEGARERINNLALYVTSKGDKYKSHYSAILTWESKNKNQAYQGYQKLKVDRRPRDKEGNAIKTDYDDLY